MFGIKKLKISVDIIMLILNISTLIILNLLIHMIESLKLYLIYFDVNFYVLKLSTLKIFDLCILNICYLY